MRRKLTDMRGSSVNPLRTRLPQISGYLGLLAALGGGISMLLRAVGVSPEDESLPSVMAAFAILLCGIALSFPHAGADGTRSRISQGLAVIALALVAATLSAYLFMGLPQGSDLQRWLIAPTTGLVVLVVAAATLCLRRPQSYTIAQGLAVLGLMVCLLALLGYMEGAIALADLGTAFPMTVPAAVLLSVLALSVLFAQPDAGPMAIVTSATSAGMVVRRLMLPLILLPMLLNFIIHRVAQIGWYAPGLANAIYTFASMITIAALVWWQVLTLHRSTVRRVELEEQTRQAEGRYGALIQAVTDYAIHTLDTEGRIDSWNTGAEHIRGWRPEEIMGHSYAELFPPEVANAGVPQQLIDAAKHEGRAVDEGWQVRKDGSRFYADTVVTAVTDAQRRLRSYAVVTQDITARVDAEKALRKSRQDLDIALRSAAFHLWHFYILEQRIEDLDALIENLGYIRSPRTGTRTFWESILHPDDLAYWRTRPLLPLPVELTEDGIELRLRTSDGNWRWMETRARIVEWDERDEPCVIAGTCLDITARKHAAEQRIRAAQHDPLTGLPNRSLTCAFGERLLDAAPRHGGQCAVLFVDLDRFKPINDTYGHAAGDAVLRQVAERLRHCVRGEDVVGRLGGDEFLVVLANAQHVEDITHVARNCMVAVGRPCSWRDVELLVSPSIGISQYPADGQDMDTLVKHADVAMYHAKQNGRNNFEFFTPAMNAQAKSLLDVESRMRRAIEQDGFCLHYQPVVDTETQRVMAAEALLRWPAENMGPDEFIPIAESSGLILPLGEWVLNEACRQHKAWIEQGMEPFRMSVNVSPFQFRQKQFREQLVQTLSDTGIEPACLQLEITENAFLQDLGEVVRTLDSLREPGIRIALDDFGRGYSSLSYLKDLPLDAIKVDRDFVHELQIDRVNLAITEAIINMAESLGLEVIAEGIETDAVLQLLKARHCRHMQGFFLSHPLPAAAFAAWYRDQPHGSRAFH
ncbi:MAG: EAL domain-containing protein [Thiogranum sp.]|nr:EAL domain-containing protein [Thiogranum sp.]